MAYVEVAMDNTLVVEFRLLYTHTPTSSIVGRRSAYEYPCAFPVYRRRDAANLSLSLVSITASSPIATSSYCGAVPLSLFARSRNRIFLQDVCVLFSYKGLLFGGCFLKEGKWNGGQLDIWDGGWDCGLV